MAKLLITEEEFLAALADNTTFSDIEIHDAHLNGTTAYNVTFQNCAFIRCCMDDCCWEGLSASSSIFVECRFIDAQLEEAVFEDCRFFDPDTSAGCNFRRSRLRSASLTRCRISSCDFEGADLFHALIHESEAVGTKFFRAHFDGAVTLTKNLFKYADFRGADLSRCDVSENDFVWAVLDEVNFEQAILLGSNLSGASIRFTKFAQTDLRGAILGSLDLRTTDIEGVKISEHQMRGLLENCGLIIFPDTR